MSIFVPFKRVASTGEGRLVLNNGIVECVSLDIAYLDGKRLFFILCDFLRDINYIALGPISHYCVTFMSLFYILIIHLILRELLSNACPSRGRSHPPGMGE